MYLWCGSQVVVLLWGIIETYVKVDVPWGLKFIERNFTYVVKYWLLRIDRGFHYFFCYFLAFDMFILLCNNKRLQFGKCLWLRYLISQVPDRDFIWLAHHRWLWLENWSFELCEWRKYPGFASILLWWSSGQNNSVFDFRSIVRVGGKTLLSVDLELWSTPLLVFHLFFMLCSTTAVVEYVAPSVVVSPK